MTISLASVHIYKLPSIPAFNTHGPRYSDLGTTKSSPRQIQLLSYDVAPWQIGSGFLESKNIHLIINLNHSTTRYSAFVLYSLRILSCFYGGILDQDIDELPKSTIGGWGYENLYLILSLSFTLSHSIFAKRIHGRRYPLSRGIAMTQVKQTVDSHKSTIESSNSSVPCIGEEKTTCRQCPCWCRSVSFVSFVYGNISCRIPNDKSTSHRTPTSMDKHALKTLIRNSNNAWPWETLELAHP